MVTRPPAAYDDLGRFLAKRVREQGFRLFDLAAAIGTDSGGLNGRLRGKVPWRFAEIVAAAEMIGESVDVLSEIGWPK